MTWCEKDPRLPVFRFAAPSFHCPIMPFWLPATFLTDLYTQLAMLFLSANTCWQHSPPPPPKCCLLFLTTFFTIPFGPTLSWAPEVKLIWCQIKLDFSFYLVGRGDFSWSLYAGFEIFVKSSTSRNMFVISFVKLLHCQSKTLLYVVIYHLNMLHTFWLTRHVILNGSDILLVYNKSFDWCLYKRNAVPATHNVSACNNSYNL